MLKIGKSRKDTIFLDIGSCREDHSNKSVSPKTDILIITVGNDARKLVADGFPLEQVVTSDLHQGD